MTEPMSQFGAHAADPRDEKIDALTARVEFLEKRWADRKRKNRRDGRKTLIEEMESTPEGRERMREARYSIAIEHVEWLEGVVDRVRELHPVELVEGAGFGRYRCVYHGVSCVHLRALEGDPQ